MYLFWQEEEEEKEEEEEEEEVVVVVKFIKENADDYNKLNNAHHMRVD